MKRKGLIIAIVLALSLGANVFLLGQLNKSKTTVDILPTGLPRGRLKIKNGTVVTDSDTLIRGMVFSSDEVLMGDENEGMRVGYEDLKLLKEQGLNCMRFYVPIQFLEPGNEEYLRQMAAADMFMDWTEELGIYVWLSAGWYPKELTGENEFDNIRRYWQEMAPRYGKREHVFFDLVNELCEPPEWFEWEYPKGAIIEFFAELYTSIRKVAPDTLCIFFSFSHILDIDDTVNQIKALEELIDIDWSNEAIGFHSYEATNKYYDEDIWINCALMRENIRVLKAAGYPLINNEVPSMTISANRQSQLTDYPNVYLLQVLEEEGISWVSMLDIMSLQAPSVWQATIEQGGLVWKGDYGDWPVVDGVNPYQPRAAISGPYEIPWPLVSMGEDADLENRGDIYVNYMPSMFIYDGAHVTYKNLNFGVLEPFSLTIRVRGFYDGSKVIAHEGGPNGPVLCEFIIDYTKGENVYYTEYLKRPISGLKDVTFTFHDPEGSDNWAVCNFIQWQFHRPPVIKDTLHTQIYNETNAFAAFNFRRGNFWRSPTTDSKAKTNIGKELQVVGIKNGDQLLFDRVVYLPVKDAKLTVRVKPLAPGRIEVFANKGFKIWPAWSMYLGTIEINGELGTWQEFSISISDEAMNQAVYGGSWRITGYDLLFSFFAEEGVSANQDIFELSEFTFEATVEP